MTNIVIVDWRSLVTQVYYENELGDGSYDVPDNPSIEICLHKKRTYNIEGKKLLGFYDDDTAANDDLLVKYLSQHKEAVLGDIIATIQKEQNQIIRNTPFKNIIVQELQEAGKQRLLCTVSHISCTTMHTNRNLQNCALLAVQICCSTTSAVVCLSWMLIMSVRCVWINLFLI